jgi:hypothetical protein
MCQRPTTSRNLATKFGSFESLNWRYWCGAKPWARQILRTALSLIPVASAIIAAVQWVASSGGSRWVSATTRSATLGPRSEIRDGRVLSRKSPSTPSVMNRSCQRQTQVFDLPVRRMIACVPSPSALKRMMAARHTCFWAALRSPTTPARRRRSVELSVIEIPVRIRKTRRCARHWESKTGRLC